MSKDGAKGMKPIGDCKTCRGLGKGAPNSIKGGVNALISTTVSTSWLKISCLSTPEHRREHTGTVNPVTRTPNNCGTKLTAIDQEKTGEHNQEKKMLKNPPREPETKL